jgi:hypothetical protein
MNSRVAGPLAGRSASKLAGYTENFDMVPGTACAFFRLPCETQISPAHSIAERLAFGERGQCCVLAQNPKNSDYFRRRGHRFADPAYCENNWNSSDFPLALTPLAKRIPCCDGGGGAVDAGRWKCASRTANRTACFAVRRRDQQQWQAAKPDPRLGWAARFAGSLDGSHAPESSVIRVPGFAGKNPGQEFGQ